MPTPVNGNCGSFTVGDVTFPIGSFAVEIERETRCPYLPYRCAHDVMVESIIRHATFTCTLFYTPFEYWSWATDLSPVLAYLGERRWKGFLARTFRNQPGVRFADLVT